MSNVVAISVSRTEGTTPSFWPTQPITSLPAAPPAKSSDRPRPMVGRSAPLLRSRNGRKIRKPVRTRSSAMWIEKSSQ